MASSAATGPVAVTTVYWDISTRCNGHCVYCSARSALGEGAQPPVKTDEALRGLRRLRRAGAEGVVFLGGEPTLRDDLGDLTCAALRLGLSVSIATNGLTMPRQLQRRLLSQQGLAINISLDSDDPAENDAVRGKGYHAACTRTLRDLLAERRAAGSSVRVTLQATLSRLNLEHIGERLQRLLDLGVDSVLLERMKTYPWHSRAVRALAPGPEEWIAAAGQAARVGAAAGQGRVQINFGLARLRAALAARYGNPALPDRICPGGLAVAVVDFGGQLHPCRAAAEQPVPVDASGRPIYDREAISIRSSRAGRFLGSPYFVDFFNFAHSVRTYERLSLCRACEHYLVCEPCPLDVMHLGDGVTRECRALLAGRMP